MLGEVGSLAGQEGLPGEGKRRCRIGRERFFLMFITKHDNHVAS